MTEDKPRPRDTSKSDALLEQAGCKPLGEDHPAYIPPGETVVRLGAQARRSEPSVSPADDSPNETD